MLPTKTSLTPQTHQQFSGYQTLRKQVEETLLLGQREIEKAKVHTYWKTGKLIQDHLLEHTVRGNQYGNQVIRKLATDLELSASVLWRCLRFARSFEIVASRQLSLPANLSWSHYRELITVPDDEIRISLMKRAEKNEWTSTELAQKITQELSRELPNRNGQKTEFSSFKLVPKRGALYTYHLIAPDSLHREGAPLWIDLGFQVHRRMPENAKGFREGALIESERKESDYSIQATQRKESDLYTYKAYIERIVDGDTLRVKIDLGFETRIRQYLRLRGIDAPEIETAEGKKARAFVERELSKADYIILTSSRSDKYDRYLADIFYGEKDEQFLNQRLLDEGLAVRM